jgi:hypothetical protein
LTISFSKDLFYKELIKSFKWLSLEEINELKNWVIAQFGLTHKKEIEMVFIKNKNKHLFNK